MPFIIRWIWYDCVDTGVAASGSGGVGSEGMEGSVVGVVA